MKKIGTSWFVLLAIVGAFMLLLASTHTASVLGEGEKTTLTGMLYGGDEEGIFIDSSEGKYAIQGRDLTQHLYEKVEVTGTVGKDDAGNNTIRVTTFKVLAEKSPEGVEKATDVEETTEEL